MNKFKVCNYSRERHHSEVFLEGVNYYCKKASSSMFDRLLNAPLSWDNIIAPFNFHLIQNIHLVFSLQILNRKFSAQTSD